MQYCKQITLKSGVLCTLRTGVAEDGAAVLAVFKRTHAQTENLLSYPDENAFTPEDEGAFLQRLADSPNEVELVAVVDGVIAGTAGITAEGDKDKVRHRADFGIGIDQPYWRLGIGRALTQACIECARQAGYAQLELSVVADNAGAIALYQSLGFTEFGRNPRGFRTRSGRWQELVLMRLQLTD